MGGGREKELRRLTTLLDGDRPARITAGKCCCRCLFLVGVPGCKCVSVCVAVSSVHVSLVRLRPTAFPFDTLYAALSHKQRVHPTAILPPGPPSSYPTPFIRYDVDCTRCTRQQQRLRLRYESSACYC